MDPSENNALNADTTVAGLAVLGIKVVIGSRWLVLSAVMLTSLMPRRDKFTAPGALLETMTRQTRKVAECETRSSLILGARGPLTLGYVNFLSLRRRVQ